MRPLDASDPTVIGPYRILGLLGGGGMGRVYLGESRTGRRLAIKVIRSHLLEDPVFRQRFAREVDAARLVSPLFTAAVVDADPDAPAPWLATRFIDGISLEQHVVEQGPLTTDRVVSLTAGLAEALSSIHRVGLVHRDLKPSNVLLDDAGPHIIDFGLALTTTSTRMTTSLVVGTPSYMAPERLSGQEAGPASDIFSLGATLVFAMTGRDLVDDASVYEQILQINEGRFDLSGVPVELRPLIVRCTSHQPRDRPTAEELTRIVVALGASLPVPVVAIRRHPLPVAPRGQRPPAIEPDDKRRSRRFLLAIGGGVGVALVAGGIAAAAGVFGKPSRSRAVAVWQPSAGTSSVPPTPIVTGPPSAGTIIWRATSGVGAPGPGPSGSGQRIIIDRQRRIVTTNGPAIFAEDENGRRAWTRTMPAALTGIWLWGDAVLVTDSRRLWLLDTATGGQRFAADPVGTETVASRTDNPDHIPVAIGQVALATDRAFVNLGTAIIAIDRTGRRAWRIARYSTAGAPQIAGGPIAANAQWLVTQDVTGTSARVGVYHAGTGQLHWARYYSVPPGPLPPPPLGGPQPDDAWQRSEGRLNATYTVVRSGQEIRVFRLSDGQRLWQSSSLAPVSAIEIVDRWALVASDRITAYELAGGVLAWQSPQSGGRLAVSTQPHVIVTGSDQGIRHWTCTAARCGTPRYPARYPGWRRTRSLPTSRPRTSPSHPHPASLSHPASPLRPASRPRQASRQRHAPMCWQSLSADGAARGWPLHHRADHRLGEQRRLVALDARVERALDEDRVPDAEDQHRPHLARVVRARRAGARRAGPAA